jgi:hypothetical protein
MNSYTAGMQCCDMVYSCFLLASEMYSLSVQSKEEMFVVDYDKFEAHANLPSAIAANAKHSFLIHSSLCRDVVCVHVHRQKKADTLTGSLVHVWTVWNALPPCHQIVEQGKARHFACAGILASSFMPLFVLVFFLQFLLKRRV